MAPKVAPSLSYLIESTKSHYPWCDNTHTQLGVIRCWLYNCDLLNLPRGLTWMDWGKCNISGPGRLLLSECNSGSTPTSSSYDNQFYWYSYSTAYHAFLHWLLNIALWADKTNHFLIAYMGLWFLLLISVVHFKTPLKSISIWPYYMTYYMTYWHDLMTKGCSNSSRPLIVIMWIWCKYELQHQDKRGYF